jgi:hypothetical protein
MKSAYLLTFLAILTIPLIAESPKGTVPRSAASKYAAHGEVGGAAIGATLLTSKDVHKAFSTDLTHCCLVVEVALYPAKDKAIDVWSDDFVLRLAGTENAFKASSSELLAAKLRKENAEAPAAVTVAAEANVGYESGTDPLTGRRIHSVESGGGLGVGVGTPSPTAAATTDRDRDVTERELREKALADDTVSIPVAGYLYFSVSKDDRKGVHQLEYTLNGQKVALKLD